VGAHPNAITINTLELRLRLREAGVVSSNLATPTNRIKHLARSPALKDRRSISHKSILSPCSVYHGDNRPRARLCDRQCPYSAKSGNCLAFDSRLSRGLRCFVPADARQRPERSESRNLRRCWRRLRTTSCCRRQIFSAINWAFGLKNSATADAGHLITPGALVDEFEAVFHDI